MVELRIAVVDCPDGLLLQLVCPLLQGVLEAALLADLGPFFPEALPPKVETANHLGVLFAHCESVTSRGLRVARNRTKWVP